MQEAMKLPPAATLPDYRKLEVHPLAELLPEASPEEYKALKESIRKNGLHEPMWLFEGKILEGRHRHRALLEIGRDFKSTDFQLFKGTYEQAKAFVFDKNLARRQLTRDQKEQIARRMIKESPKDSNRVIARRCGLSHVTVGKLRKEGDPGDSIDKDFEKFARDWEKLNEQQQERFVEQFKTDLRELLLEV